MILQAEHQLDTGSAALEAQMVASPKFTSAAVCEMEEKNVLQCFQSDPMHTLNCQALVSAYSDCAARARRATFSSLS